MSLVRLKEISTHPQREGACCGITVEAVKAEDGSMTPEALRKAVGRCSQSSDMQQ